ncbi:tyrocidine synthase 1 [Clostridium tepidiprofundi DSM 19306]|uniref:Tyrocidine synthase 1 n=2 Tax=Clostridium TaxID=1485 RepID=A0A151B225_9CLOT|nr:tyrocidine synthase 1 [Clostridium tepidiprofundi DSM 19306]
MRKDEVALYYKGKEYTYGKVDRMANAVAEKVENMTKSSLVGVMMSGSAEYVISVLGILKSGRGFVPMDKNYPSARKNYIIHDCHLDTLIISDMEEKISEDDIRHIIVEDIEKENNISLEVKTEIAYVLYTSGTTGMPKGIMVGHESIENLITWFQETYEIEKNKNVIQMANIFFDVSIEEIFGCLLNGGKLYIPEENIKSHKGRIREFIKENHINIVQVVPVLLEEIFAHDERIDSIRVLICGGEVLSNELKDIILTKGYRLYNHYGPTETTVDSTRSICTKDKKVTLGKPIKNSNCFILTQDGELVTKNASGELCVSGKNLALGYLNNEKLTSEKFMVINGERLYKTGDKAFINSEGEIEYLGRMDNQVKLRGRRIELDEIDNCFSKLDGISLCNSVLIENETGGKIVTFYVANTEYNYGEVVSVIKNYLPEYMVPAEIHKLDHFEQDSNGKISKSGLKNLYKKLEEENKSDEQNRDYKNEIEEDEVLKIVAKNVAEVLEKEMYKLNPNITLDELGMDSIKFVQTVVKLEDAFDVEFEDDRLVLTKFKSLKELAEYVENIS